MKYFHVVVALIASVANAEQPKSVIYQVSTVVEQSGKPIETRNSTVRVLEGTVQRTEYPDGRVHIANLTLSKSIQLDTRNHKLVRFSANKESEQVPKSYYGILEVHSDVRPIGEQMIDGRKSEGFQSKKQKGGLTVDTTWWVDVETNHPLQIRIVNRYSDSKVRQITTLSGFQYNSKPQAQLFSIDPPIGYTVDSETIESIDITQK